jgi:hypothetical protein
MRPIKKAALVLVCFLVLACCVLELMHAFRFGHFAPLGLHADVIVRKADYGIPGISKVYEPRLSNFGIAPKMVMVCRVKEDWDSASFVIEVGNSIEKWNPNSKQWENIFRGTDKSFGCPHPTAKRLWLLQSVSGGEVAAAGYDIFEIGSHARFVVFPGDQKAISTAPFLIDEHQTLEGVPFRVRQ